MRRELTLCFLLVTWADSHFLVGQTTQDRIQDLTEKARRAQQSGRFEEARGAYEEILKIQPRWAPAEFNVGLMYHLEKEYFEAIRLLTLALQHDSTLAPAYLFRGIAYYNVGQYEKAVASLRRFQELRTEDREVRFFLAGAYNALKDYPNAAVQYLEQIKLDPQREESYYRLGECYLALAREEERTLGNDAKGKYFLWLISAEGRAQRKDEQTAESSVRESLKIDTQAPEAYILMGQLLVQQGKAAAAKTYFEDALTRSPRECRALAGMADAELALGDIEASLKPLRQAFSIWPACVIYPPAENLGLAPAEFDLRVKTLTAYATSPQWKDPVAFQLSRLKGRPSGGKLCGAGGHVVRASCLESQDDLPGATRALLAARSLSARDPESVYLSARIFMRLATRSMARLMSLAPDSHFVAMTRALLMEEQGNDKEAEGEYQRAIVLGSRDPDPLIEYARFKCKQNLFREAIPLLEKAAELDPYNVRAHALLGEAYVSTDQAGAAVSHLEMAVKARPEDEQSRIYLARSLAGGGRLKEAVAVLEAAPSDDDGRIHYVLATYYRQQGRSEDATRALEIFAQRQKSSKGTAGAPRQ